MGKEITWPQFIDFWQQFYGDSKHPDEKFYYPYIKDLSKDDFLEKLWRWKMGVHYGNKNSQNALKLMEKNKEIIRNFRKSNPTFNILQNFSREIFKTGIIYQVFLMHICKPDEYPIFDQNVFRAFIFLTTKEIVKEPKSIQDYLNYRKFVLGLHKQYKIKLRYIDKGLMVFGQFLSNPQRKIK